MNRNCIFRRMAGIINLNEEEAKQRNVSDSRDEYKKSPFAACPILINPMNVREVPLTRSKFSCSLRPYIDSLRKVAFSLDSLRLFYYWKDGNQVGRGRKWKLENDQWWLVHACWCSILVQTWAGCKLSTRCESARGLIKIELSSQGRSGLNCRQLQIETFEATAHEDRPRSWRSGRHRRSFEPKMDCDTELA